MEDSGNDGISLEGTDKGLVSSRSRQVLVEEGFLRLGSLISSFFLALTSDEVLVGGPGNRAS